MQKRSLSVVVPCYNESHRIGKTLKAILSFLKSKKWDYEVIVVNDGSQDNTFGVVRKFENPHLKLISYTPNHGKGYAVNQGLRNSQKKWVLFTDADSSTSIDQVEKLFEKTHDSQVVIGSRNADGAHILIKQPWLRSKLGKLFPFFAELIVPLEIKDTQCGFKLFRKDIAHIITRKQRIFGWGFDVEFLYIAKSHGFSIAEVPVDWYNDKGSKLHAFRDGLRMLKELFKIRINAILGRYR